MPWKMFVWIFLILVVVVLGFLIWQRFSPVILPLIDGFMP